jgi:carboxyl-terminal processing protease
MKNKKGTRSALGLCSLLRILLAGLAALAFGLAPLPSPGTTLAALDGSSLISTSTPEGRLAVFDDVWGTIEERYYDPTFHGIDWQASRVNFRPLAARANGSHEFYEVIRKMIAALRDAHTRVYAPDEKYDWWNPRFVTVGFTIREVEGLPTVVHVEQDSPAAQRGIRPGDVVVKIDDVPSLELIRDQLQQSQPADALARFRAFSTLLEGAAGTSVKVAWQTRKGKTRAAEFTRFWTERHLGFSSQQKGNLAIIRIDAFTQPLALDFAKALPKMISGAAGIILDFRANGGGDAEAMTDVASLFLEDGTKLGRFADRSGGSLELQTYLKRLWPSASTVRLPLAVLTSESTSSAAEIMTSALQTKHRAEVVGTETCGCVLAIRNRHGLPDGGVLDVSEFDYKTADGSRLEGHGIRPDKVTTMKRQDLYTGRDRALERAASDLKTTSKK